MALEYKDYYETLGVSRDASQEDLKRAFRKLARQWHPDHAKAADRDQAESKFKEINEAYEVLGDADKRKRYDQLGANWQNYANAGTGGGFRAGGASGQGGPGFEYHFGGTGFSDFFEHFFSGGGRSSATGGYTDFEDPFGARQGMRGAGRTRVRKGHDLEADLLVSLEEANNGAEKTISLRRARTKDLSSGVEHLKVRIPAGVREGQRIRLAGKGHPSGHGGPSGDLYLNVRLERHPDFRVEGTDLHYELELAPWDAVLGCSRKVPTLRQHISVKIPAGTPSGRKLRLKGLGLLRPDQTRGDLYVIPQISAPPAANEQQRQMWEALAKAYKA